MHITSEENSMWIVLRQLANFGLDYKWTIYKAHEAGYVLSKFWWNRALRDRCWERPKFRMQANSSWLPTLHSVHLFAPRRSIFLLSAGFFYNTRWERAVVEVVCVNREALIIALIWKVWVKDILKMCALQVAILNWNFSGYLRIKTVFDTENQIDAECKKFYNRQQNKFIWRFYKVRVSLICHRRGCLIQPFPGSLSNSYKIFLVRCYDTNSWIEETMNSL